MLSIAGQTAGPIGLKIFVTLMGGRGCYRLKNRFFSQHIFLIYFFRIFFFKFFSRATPGPLASTK